MVDIKPAFPGLREVIIIIIIIIICELFKKNRKKYKIINSLKLFYEKGKISRLEKVKKKPKISVL